MNIKIKIAPILQDNCRLPAETDVTGNTIGECLDDLIRQYPEAKSQLFNMNGMPTVFASINDDITLTPNTGDLDRTVKEDDVLHLFAIIAGG